MNDKKGQSSDKQIGYFQGLELTFYTNVPNMETSTSKGSVLNLSK